MTSTRPAAAPLACPDCGRPLDGGPVCPSCALPLTGPAALRLWHVDQELLRLGTARDGLLVERSGLLRALRGGPPAAPSPGVLPPGAVPAQADPPVAPRPEWTPRRVQNLLLALGALLLAVAGAVFAAVTYERLGAGGRAAVLLGLTAAAALAVPRVRARGLGATAEAVAAVGVALAVLDAYGLRRLGVGGDVDLLAYLAGSTAALALLVGGYARAVPVRVARAAAVLLAQLPVPFLLLHLEVSAGTAALAFVGLAAVDVAGAELARRRAAGDLVRTAAACAALVGLLGTGLAAGAAYEDQPGLGALGLLAAAALLFTSAQLVRAAGGRALLAGAAVLVLAAAAHAATRSGLAEAQEPLVVAAVALLAALGAAQLPAAHRPGPVGGALAVAGLAVLAVGEQVADAVGRPLGWLSDPWSLPAGASAREALAPFTTWTGGAAPVAVLAAAAVTAVTAGLALQRLRSALPVAALLGVGVAVLLPLGLDTPYRAGLALLLLVTALLAAGGALLGRRQPDAALALLCAAAGTGALTAAWSTADRTATLVVLPVLAAVAAGLAVAPGSRAVRAVAAAVAGAAGTAELAAAGAARGLAADQVGGLLLLAVAALLAGAAALAVAAPGAGRDRRSAVEGTAVAAAVVAAGLAAGDAGWLSWVLAGCGLLALATALLPDRRRVAVVGVLLLAGSSWVRLGDAGVTAPEPYVLPVALLALGLGVLRRRSDASIGSWPAYAPGLGAALVPSLLASLGDPDPTRGLLLGAAALGVLLVGARTRLQAPLLLGGGVLAVDALVLLAPYADALPRWLSLGAAGALLVAVGATYEQRRQDLRRLRDRVDALG